MQTQRIRSLHMQWNVVNEVEPAIQRAVETDPNLTKWGFSSATACKY